VKPEAQATSTNLVYVFTFGWSPEPVVRVLVEEGVPRDTTIVLLFSRLGSDYADAKIEEALKQVRSFLELAQVSSFHYVEVDVDAEFLEVCRNVLRALKDFIDG